MLVAGMVVVGMMGVTGCSGNNQEQTVATTETTIMEDADGKVDTEVVNEEEGKKTLTDVKEINPGELYSCSYDGYQHEFIVCLPEETKQAPVILMLHGYADSAETFRTMTAMEKTAVPRGYAVVYVTGAPDAEDPTSGSGWNSGINGSKKDDVGFLKALAEYLQEEYEFDTQRTFVAGFSNGAFMAQRLAMDASDTFCAVASVAGMMPEGVWNRRNEENHIGVLQINGTKDDVVPMQRTGTDKTAKNPAIELVMDYWASSNGLNSSETEALSEKAELIKYSGEGDSHVWHVIITDGRHSWPDKQLVGFDVNEVILDFFNVFCREN